MPQLLRAHTGLDDPRLLAISAATGTGFFEWDMASNTVNWSRDTERIYGVEVGVGLRDWDEIEALLHEDDLEALAEILAHPPETLDGVVTFEHRIVRPDGAVRTLTARGVPIRDGDTLVGWRGTVWDTTEEREKQRREQATFDAIERARADSESRFRAIFEASLDAMLLCDDGRVFLAANEAACALLGRAREEIVGRRQEEVTGAPVEATEEAWRTFVAEGAQQGEWPLARPDGSVRIVDFRATAHIEPGVHLSILRDVTAQRQLEEELRQSQKLEAVGRLAGGVAHDFNNLLTAVFGFTEVARRDLFSGRAAAAAAALEQINEVASSARDLTQQLLAFARKQVLCPQLVRADDEIGRVVPMLRRVLGGEVELTVELAADGAWVVADPAAIQQILVNLSVNARDAMPGGGELRIVSRRSATHFELTVADSGHGIDAELLPHLFEPFFTTKDVGEGTGLGLATVHGIVSQSGGTIAVDSRTGAGTTFTVSLPLADAPADEAVANAATHDGDTPVAGTNVLLVEDERIVRNLTAIHLQELGCRVTVAASPAEALALAEERDAQPFDLLLTDMMMPQIRGSELAARLRERWPNLRIVLTSGYSPDYFGGDGEHHPQEIFLQKPYTNAELARALARATGSADPPS